jgi:hypothetical protein
LKANTALAFVFSGTALWLLREDSAPRASRIAAGALGTVTTAVAVATLAEYVFGVGLGIDHLFRDSAGHRSYPGRPSPHTAIAFLAVGLWIVVLARQHDGVDRIRNWLSLCSQSTLGAERRLGAVTPTERAIVSSAQRDVGRGGAMRSDEHGHASDHWPHGLARDSRGLPIGALLDQGSNGAVGRALPGQKAQSGHPIGEVGHFGHPGVMKVGAGEHEGGLLSHLQVVAGDEHAAF